MGKGDVGACGPCIVWAMFAMWGHVGAYGVMWGQVGPCSVGHVRHVGACGGMWGHVGACRGMWGHIVWAMLVMWGFWCLGFGVCVHMGHVSRISRRLRLSPTCSVELFNALDHVRPLTAGTSPLTCTDY